MDQHTTPETHKPPGQGTQQCPYCAETIQAAAIKCRYCGSHLAGPAGSPLRDDWYRLREGRILGGVCAGMAYHFNVSVSLLRLAFIIGVPFSGAGVIIYLILWIILPLRDLSKQSARRQPRLPTEGPAE